MEEEQPRSWKLRTVLAFICLAPALVIVLFLAVALCVSLFAHGTPFGMVLTHVSSNYPAVLKVLTGTYVLYSVVGAITGAIYIAVVSRSASFRDRRQARVAIGALLGAVCAGLPSYVMFSLATVGPGPSGAVIVALAMGIATGAVAYRHPRQVLPTS